MNHEGRQTRILNAADAVLGEKGFDGASSRDIARHAGVGKFFSFMMFSQ